MSRVNDEFNYVKISNEEDIPSFEFGSTPSEESASYKDNHDQIHDEVNDNPSSNDENKSPEKKEKRRKEEQKEKEGSDKSSKGSSGSSGAGSLSAASAAVVAAVCVVTGIVSIAAGVPQEVNNVILTPHETSINCAFDITNSDSTIKYKVELYNNDLEARFEKESQIGHNELEFTDLESSTTYTFEIFRGNPNEQQEYSYESIYSETVTTLDLTGPFALTFDSNGRDGTMNSLEFESGSEYTLPVSIFVPFDDEIFGGWKINGKGDKIQPGETIVVKKDTTLVAAWDKLPTKEQSTTANRMFFSYFPPESSQTITTVSLAGIDFQVQYVYYGSSTETLNFGTEGGFVSTTKPFGGTLSRITINTSADQTGDVNFTMVYSASPIDHKVTEPGETHTFSAGSTYTFECSNPDARYFCLSNGSSSVEPHISSMEFVYNVPDKSGLSFNVTIEPNGGIGESILYPIRDNKGQLPSISTVGFEPQEGYEFAGWKVNGVDDLLEPETTIGISCDITLLAQWKEKGPNPNYTVSFDPNGGSEVISQLVEEGNRVIRPDDPTRLGFIFLDWYTDSELTNPYDFDEAVASDFELKAGWKPDIDFSMYINYFDSLSAEPSCQLSYSYTKNDNDYSIFTDYYLEIEGNETVSFPISSLDNTDTYVTKTLQLDVSAVEQFGSEIINYTMKGRTSRDETFDLATGSFDGSRTQKDYVKSIYFGNEKLQSNNDEAYRVMKSGSSSSSSYYIPVRFDYADFTNKHRANTSNDWRLRYTLDGETYTNATFSYSSGTAFVNISSTLFQSTDTVTFREISFLDGNDTPQQIGNVYENITVQASDEKYVGGFRLNTSYLLNPSRTPTFTLSAVGTRGVDIDNPNDNHRFINLGVNEDGFEANLTFRLLSKDNQIEKEYIIDVTQNLIDNASQVINYTNVEFSFIDENTGVDKREEFIEQSKRFVVDAVLTITPASGTPFVCKNYESYSFR